MITEFDTIAAISTGLSEGGIGIIRVSGPDSVSCVSKVFVNNSGKHLLNSYKSHTIHYGFVKDTCNDCILDEVMVSVMKAPNSYTMEDVVEINCHGGIIILNKILELVLEQGVRLAEPGEFTKRAFLNGRIDLSRAEAVMDMIHAQNEFAMKASASNLRGVISDQIVKLREEILYEIAYIESALDDPEHISLDGYNDSLSVKISNWLSSTDMMINNARNGRILSNGIRTAIIGKPNAGKSSILNALLRENRAIVTDIAGTTRDTLEETVRIGSLSLVLIDTAGIRETQDIVEKIGVDKSKSEISKADLVLFVCDSSSDIDDNDLSIIDMLKEISPDKGIILFNKSDLAPSYIEDEVKSLLPSFKFISTCAKSDSIDGISELEHLILSLFNNGKISNSSDEIYMTNLRHIEAMEAVNDSLNKVMDSINMGMPEDFLSIDLNDAYVYLGNIIGEELSDDVINEIFSKFCMGK